MNSSIEDMAAYYARRAATYERIYHKPERQADLRALEAALPPIFAGRRVLEIACGTGWWTPHGARDAVQWLATDLSAEAMAIAQSRQMPACVRFAKLDAYALHEIGAMSFDAAFAGFWWSHVSRQRLAAWLQTLHVRLPAGARVVMIDNRYVPGSSTPIGEPDEHGNTWQLRALDDGTTHRVLKNFPTRDEAVAALGPRARNVQWTDHEHYWMLSYELS